MSQDLIRGYQRTIEDLRLELARSREALEQQLKTEDARSAIELRDMARLVESLRAEMDTLREHLKGSLLHARKLRDALGLTGAEVESLRAERGALGSTPYQAELVRLAALVDQHHSADLFGVDLAPSIWGRKCLVCDAALTSVEGGPVAQARGAATDSVIEPPSTSPPSERFCPTCGAECHCPWHGEMPCTDPFHTQPSDTEEVHVRIRDGRVTAMDGGPAPAAPSGATVVLHHDEEEEA